MNENTSEKVATLTLLLLVFAFCFAIIVYAVPEGPRITFLENSTKVASNGSGPRADGKGVITVLQLDVEQQDTKWKAYVGNVTGSFVLQDSDGYNIYSWPGSSNLSGNVFVTRNNTVLWGFIRCSNSTILQTEQSALSFTGSGVDNIQNTFNNSNHSLFNINGINVTGCPYIATYQRNSSQTPNASNNTFQEIAIAYNYTADAVNSSVFNVIYATRITQDAQSYNTNRTYDFQILVPDFGLASISTLVTYYFYVELS